MSRRAWIGIGTAIAFATALAPYCEFKVFADAEREAANRAAVKGVLASVRTALSMGGSWQRQPLPPPTGGVRPWWPPVDPFRGPVAAGSVAEKTE